MKAYKRQTLTTPQVQTISRWRWIILLVSICLVVAFEIVEHRAVTSALVLELAVYGATVAASTWVLLTFLARQLARQAYLEDTLERQRRFSQQLAHYRDREELADFIVRFPRASMPVDQVILFQYDHLKAHMEFSAEWNADEQLRPAARYSALPGNIPYVRAISKSPSLHESTTCPLIASSTKTLGGKHFCLPLVHDSILVGLLRLRCLPGNTLSPEQMQFLNSISAQMALALALSIALPRQLSDAQQAERRRLAYELHDSLAQQIGYLHLGLDRLADDERLENVTWLQSELARLREVAGESYLQVRGNLNLLQNQDATDLVQTIKSYIRSVEPQVPYQIEFRTSGTPIPLGPLTCQHVFGLIQEGLNNARKHAQAQRVTLALLWQADQLDITLTDDGAGFDLSAAQSNGHYGLIMLRERTLELRGEMRITSAPDAGTSLQFAIPLRTR